MRRWLKTCLKQATRFGLPEPYSATSTVRVVLPKRLALGAFRIFYSNAFRPKRQRLLTHPNRLKLPHTAELPSP